MTTEHGAPFSCPACGHENHEGDRFCNSCGQRLDAPCPACGTPNVPGSRFCSSCGHDLTAQSPAEPANDIRAPSSIACPRCHHPNDVHAEFCYNCGLPLADEGAAAVRANRGIPAYATGSPGGFWVRVGAWIIDNVVILGLLGVLLPITFDVNLGDYLREDSYIGGPDLLNYALSFLYVGILVSRWATTVGKRALAMYIVRVDGSRVGFGRAVGREAAKILSFVLLGAGFFMIGMRADKRGLHDLIADTVVVKR
jgi:uncharacterized RDD family membrane protein YckC